MADETLEQLQAKLAALTSQKEAAEQKAAEAEAKVTLLAEEKDAVVAEKKKLEEDLDTVSEEKELLAEENQKLSSEVKAVNAEAAKNAPVSFEVEDDEEKGIDGGDYEFTCPTFTWDDGSVVNVRERFAKLRVLAEQKSLTKEEKEFVHQLQTMCAELVKRQSGIVRRKEK